MSLFPTANRAIAATPVSDAFLEGTGAVRLVQPLYCIGVRKAFVSKPFKRL